MRFLLSKPSMSEIPGYVWILNHSLKLLVLAWLFVVFDFFDLSSEIFNGFACISICCCVFKFICGDNENFGGVLAWSICWKTLSDISLFLASFSVGSVEQVESIKLFLIGDFKRTSKMYTLNRCWSWRNYSFYYLP